MNKIEKKEVIRTLELFQGVDLKEVRLLDGKLNASGYFSDAAAIFGEKATFLSSKKRSFFHMTKAQFRLEQ